MDFRKNNASNQQEGRVSVFAMIKNTCGFMGVILTLAFLGSNVSADSIPEIKIYKGIRYAKPPVGELRFRAPVEIDNQDSDWSRATEYGAECPQLKPGKRGKFDEVSGSEDCLFLNVWAPTGQSEKLPVLFFIHGGAQIMGSSSGNVGGYFMYEGSRLAQSGPAIVVSVNYRLGAMGFLAHPALSSESGQGSGNFALLDLVMALKWVQKNISAMGGDPKRVTVFGESAGAINTIALLASPLAQGLFSSAIIQSGLLSGKPLKEAEVMGLKISEQLGCRSVAIAEKELECLRSKPVADFVKLVPFEKFGMNDGIFFEPVVDGHVLAARPLDVIRQGEHNRASIILGTNRDEMNMLMTVFGWDFFVTAGDYRQSIRKMFGPVVSESVLEKFPAWSRGSPRKTFQHLMSNVMFHCPNRTLARELSKQSIPVWKYVFTHRPRNILGVFGASHAFELMYIFGNFPQNIFFPKLKLERKFSERVSELWLEMARSGRLPEERWPQYDLKEDTYLDLSPRLHKRAGFRMEECDFLDGVIGLNTSG